MYLLQPFKGEYGPRMVQKPCAHIIQCWHSLIVTELSIGTGAVLASGALCLRDVLTNSGALVVLQLFEAVCGALRGAGMSWWSGTSDSMTCLGRCRAEGLVWGLELCALQIYLSCLVGRTFKLNRAPWQLLFYRKRQFTPKESASYNQYLVKVNDQGECNLGGDIWQRKCVPQYPVKKSGSRQVPHSDWGQPMCHMALAGVIHILHCANRQNKNLSVGLVTPQQKKPKRQTQNFELITRYLQVFKRISNKNIFSSIFRTRHIKKKNLRAVRKYSHEFKLPIQMFNL